MPSLFSRLTGKDGKKSKKGQLDDLANLPQKPRWDDAWARTNVDPEEVDELIHYCSAELKARALDLPFLLLPFRPTSDPSAVRTFVRHFFDGRDGSPTLRGEALAQELRMTEPMVISGVIKWCWSRLQGGVVGWDSYELFKVGEHDSNMDRNSFKTFIPLSVDNKARSQIIFDFFDLLSAVAAHGKMNGFGGRKLSRMAAWWAFEQTDATDGFETAYKAWLGAADATSHLFFAYLRSLAPEPVRGGISLLPMSLQKLLQDTEYPPQRPQLMQTSTYRVAMIVDTVSPTPFALLRRANHFQYRESDKALKEFSEYEDPIQALTEECRRVLRAISAANQSHAVSSSKHSTSLRDASWSRFEDIGFASALEEEDESDGSLAIQRRQQRLRNTPASGGDLGRPTTPSWADFLSSGFVDEKNASHLLLPPDKVLPPIETGVRNHSSQSHRPRLEDNHLEPGELASIVRFDLDDAFWWVWLTSLAPEETPDRKSAFGRCAVIETVIRGGRWLVMEEIVKGAATDPAEGAYIAEKKGFFSWTRRGKTNGLTRSKSTAGGKHALVKGDGHLKPSSTMGFSKTSIGPDQQAKIQAAAHQLQLQEKQKAQEQSNQRRGRNDPNYLTEKTNSVMTLQPGILNEASSAVKWTNKYDKDTVRGAYLADTTAGRGIAPSGPAAPVTTNPVTDQPPNLPPKAQAPGSITIPTAAKAPESVGTSTPETPKPVDKELQVSKETHPAERPSDVARSVPLPPPKDHESLELSRDNMVSPDPDASPDDKKQKKLHKEAKSPTSGGFRKLFGRARRHSKLPENATEQLNTVLAAPVQAQPAQPVVAEKVDQPKAQPVVVPPPQARKAVPPPQPQATAPAPAPVTAPAPAPASAPAPAPAPVSSPVSAPEPELTYEPSLPDDEISRVSTREPTRGSVEFSRFDQGPLLDQPAFVPDEDSEDEAVPPPIARHSSRSPLPSPSPVTQPPVSPPPPQQVEEKAASPPAPISRAPVQDRWAQIRKNAAERAAQRGPASPEPASRSRPADFPMPKRNDGDDTTSEEETIESRVARIKARVAELTGGQEGAMANVRPPPLRR
ncbi:hypothetical protein QBC38DRAFT_189134 [Podospora fimiseda]|uniref:Meiotically up-regulated protein Msb1/Mug8 domain-containing protein n=1 Tax=Podospora fimiseda TaxID=252190 RepID=A0AAN7H2S9_9PEZI|nr:hypothetical protein QBC38DRAFT_189134 [Podospora fimiseda]